jgi:CubicO group peptidase (beta-lactamase class C family)
MRASLFTVLWLFSAFGYSQSLGVATTPADVELDPQRLARIDQLVSDYIAQKKIPGAVAMIVRNGKVAYWNAFGVSDVASKRALKKDDIFRIASQSKAVTSLAVMMLFEEGKFLLDDPLSRYIPEFGDPKVLTAFSPEDSTFTAVKANRQITIRDLLTHTSGIDYAAIGSREFTAIYAKAGVPSGIGNQANALREKMRVLASLPLKHHPGEHFTYGLNMDVLGYLVEVLSGMTLNDFFQKRIFDPLGMKDTYFYVPREKHNRVVALHEIDKNQVIKVGHPVYDNVNPEYPTSGGTYFSGGAGLSSTVEDYARFLQLFLNKGELNGVRLLGRKTVELMLTLQTREPINSQVGLGFGLETENNDHRSIVSLGTFSWGGAFSTSYWADPKEQLIGLFFTNVYNHPYGDVHDKFKALTYQSVD